MFLATQHLPFCGQRENVIYKQWDVLELGEFFSDYNPILKEHFVKIKHVISSKRERIIFLSKKIIF